MYFESILSVYQKLGIYCERTEPYVLFEVLSIALFFLRLARILIQ